MGTPRFCFQFSLETNIFWSNFHSKWCFLYLPKADLAESYLKTQKSTGTVPLPGCSIHHIYQLGKLWKYSDRALRRYISCQTAQTRVAYSHYFDLFFIAGLSGVNKFCATLLFVSQCFLASIVSISVVICVSWHFSFFLLYWNSILSTKIVAKLISFSLFDWGITEKRSFGPAFDSLTFARHVELSDAGWRGYVVKKKIQTMSKSIHHMKN